MPSLHPAARMHQYYRDVLSTNFVLPYLGGLDLNFIQKVMQNRVYDLSFVLDHLLDFPPGNDVRKDKALRILLTVFCQANAVCVKYNPYSRRLPEPILQSIQSGLWKIMELDTSIEYLLIAVQIMYLVGDIEGVLEISQQAGDKIRNKAAFQKIMAMIYIANEDYEQALPYLADLIENPSEADDRMVSLMAMSCMFNLGAFPEKPVDFSTLRALQDNAMPGYAIEWVRVEKQAGANDKPVIFVACDKHYFFEHALALVYSMVETNAGQFDLHLHLYNPDAQVIEALRSLMQKFQSFEITVTAEYFIARYEGIKTEFASRRFIAASMVLEKLDRPLLCVDADALFRTPWKQWVGEDNALGDIALAGPGDRVRPFWEKIPAGIIFLKNSEGAKQFIKSTAKFIYRNIQQGNRFWFLDQIALSACLSFVEHETTRVLTINGLLDTSHQDESFLWAVTQPKTGLEKYDAYKKMLLAKY